MESKTSNFFKSEKVTASFAIISIIGGIFFLGKAMITGNAITKNGISNTSPFLTTIGLLLLISSIVLFSYSLRKR